MIYHREIRQTDTWGAGYYLAPRGDHTHKGIDLKFMAGEQVFSHIDGEVTHIGYPYADEKKRWYRYIEITQADIKHRYFYIEPCVKVGDKVRVMDKIGTSQDLDVSYPGITQHVHYEVKQGVDYLNPHKYFLVNGYD